MDVWETVGLRVTVLLSVRVGDGLRWRLPLNVKVGVGVTSCVAVHEKDRLAVLEGPVWLPVLLTVDPVKVLVGTGSQLPLNVREGENLVVALRDCVGRLTDADGERRAVIVEVELAEGVGVGVCVD